MIMHHGNLSQKVFNNAILHQMNSLIIPYLQAVEPDSGGEKVLLLCASQLSGWVRPRRPDVISKTIIMYISWLYKHHNLFPYIRDPLISHF